MAQLQDRPLFLTEAAAHAWGRSRGLSQPNAGAQVTGPSVSSASRRIGGPGSLRRVAASGRPRFDFFPRLSPYQASPTFSLRCCLRGGAVHPGANSDNASPSLSVALTRQGNAIAPPRAAAELRAARIVAAGGIQFTRSSDRLSNGVPALKGKTAWKTLRRRKRGHLRSGALNWSELRREREINSLSVSGIGRKGDISREITGDSSWNEVEMFKNVS